MKKYKIYIGLLLPVIIFTAVLPYLVEKGKFLILDKPIESRVLLIEGWLNKEALDRPPFSYDDFDTIYIAGIRKTTDWDFLLRERIV
ncbi:MAG: hypothetical protein HC905_26070 [Bacteroidales bacterium]|nr:hypothetical protein [Bacteroidales bacterium]